MSSPLRGIAAYKARKEAEESRRAAAQQPRVNRYSLEKDGDSAIVRFAQEVDPDAKHYSVKNGIGFVNVEHTHPDPKQGWKNRGNCSHESQGACLPCERARDDSVEWADRKGWKQKERFYINVVAGEPREVKATVNGKEVTRTFATDIDRKTGDGTVYLLEQGTFNGIWDALVEEAVENETITENFFKIKRKGSGFNDTSYVLTKLAAVPDSAKDVETFELINIEDDVLREVAYAQQEAFYFRGLATNVVDEAREPVPVGSATSTDEGW